MRTSELEKTVTAAQIIILSRGNKDPFTLDYHNAACNRTPISEQGDNGGAVDCSACWYEWDVRAKVKDATGDVAYLERAIAALDWHEQVTELFVPLDSFDESTRAVIIAVHKEKKRIREQWEYQQYKAMFDDSRDFVTMSDLRGSGPNSSAVRRAIRRTSGKIV